MTIVQNAFMLFYAIFWGVLLTTASSFRPFGIDGFTKGGSAAKSNFIRFVCALFIFNIGPALWFIVLLKYVVPEVKYEVLDLKACLAILAAASASLSVFSFLNFGYALFCAEPLANSIYTPDELKELKQDKPKQIQATSSCCFSLLGLLYIVLFLMLALGLRCCS